MAVVLTGALPATAPAANPGRTFFGIQTWTLANADDVKIMARGRVGTLRTLFPGTLSAAQDSPSWAPYDELMMAAAKHRIEVLPTLLGIPGESKRIRRPTTGAQWRAWERFVTAVAERYGRGGAFWEDHPELTPMPLKAYQVWNEPNLPAYWRPSDDTRGYLRLVRRTRTQLRRVDRQALIVLGGLPDSKLGTRSQKYLASIYAQRGSRSLFDVVALHPYSRDARGVLAQVNRMRRIMDRGGDRRTPIWITELGWATSGPRSPFTTSTGGQATRISRTFRALLGARSRLRLGRVIVFGLQDRRYGPTEKPWWGPRVGLFTVYGRPKPGWNAFVRIAGGQSGGRLRSVTLGAEARRARP